MHIIGYFGQSGYDSDQRNFVSNKIIDLSTRRNWVVFYRSINSVVQIASAPPGTATIADKIPSEVSAIA